MRKTLMIGAALAALHSTAAFAQSTIRLCTGGETGIYYPAGKKIAAMAGKAITINVVVTEGTMDNMERTLDLPASSPDACDAMIGQPNGPNFLKRTAPAKAAALREVGKLHREYLHLICSKESGIDDLSEIIDGKSKLIIGERGSGAWLLWQDIVAEDESYAAVPTVADSGSLALASVANGEDNIACMLRPAGLGDGIVAEADRNYGDQVVLGGAYGDKDFNDATDISGKPLYSFDYAIPGKTYPTSFNYWSDVKTISWNAGVYVNRERLAGKELEAFVQALGRAAQGIKAEYGK